MDDLTRREEDFLSAVRAHVAAHGCPPTREELRQALGWKSVNSVTHCLNSLVAKGRLQVVPRSARGIRIVDASIRRERVPIVTHVGPGLLPAPDDGTAPAIPAAAAVALFRTRPDFFLRIQGEAAAEVGLHDGDLVAVRAARGARRGDIVVVRVDDQAAVRVVRLGDGRIAPAAGPTGNDAVALRHERLDIRGVVIASLRLHGGS